ncbi:competence type IV pilus minor pilin ComGF [Listeria welshimeri]|uniref:competence type IV pilus minor pilin ComGF n=1 Tax=Listeria welshimeri TaxID=1643 RepID=UPI001E42A754
MTIQSEVITIKEEFKSVLKTSQKRDVYFNSNTPAFTLLETILSITIVLSISSLIPLFFQCYNKTIQLSNLDQTMEWQLFLIQARLELEKGSDLRLDENKLSFQKDGNQITYSKYNDILRRQVNTKGHEPLLTKIKDWKIIQKEKQLIMTVKFSDDSSFTTKFPSSETKVSK